MGFKEKFKDFFTPVDSEYEEEEVMEEQPVHEEKGFDFAPSRSSSRDKVVNFGTGSQLQVVLVKPERFEDAPSIADHLNAKKTVVLNLEAADRDVSRRIIDFLSGVAYAIDGRIQRVANNTFIITPYNVDLKGDLIDELENNGLYF